MKTKFLTALLTMVMVATTFSTALGAEDASGVDESDVAAESVVTEESQEEAVLMETVENVKVKKSGVCKLKVSWSKVEDADGYYVYRSKKAKSGFGKVKTIRKGTTLSFTQQVIPDKKYYYKVKAYGTVTVNTDTGELHKSSADADGSSISKKFVISEASDTVSGKIEPKRSFKVKAYAYSGGGTTASGKKAKVGRIAVDPRVIPLGTWLYVPGYGLCQACDTGGAIKGKTVDLYMNTNAQCNKWGIRYPKIHIL